MDPARIAVRALFAFVFLQILTRLAGKRFVAQATGFDLVLALVLGDMIDDLLWAEVPASQFAVAAAVVTTAQVLMSAASSASEAVNRLAGGVPRMFARDGALLRPALRAERANVSEAKAMLRGAGLDRRRLPEVRSAWIERSGRLGLLKKDWAEPVQEEDLERLAETGR